MKFFNQHEVPNDKLVKVLNAHMERGWDLHHIHTSGDGKRRRILFVREFANTDERDAYLEQRRQRHATQSAQASADAATSDPGHSPAPESVATE